MKIEKLRLLFVVTALIAGCRQMNNEKDVVKENDLPDQFLVVLGIAQDAGFPQAGCEKECCAAYYSGMEEKKGVTSLALVDKKNKQYWLFEATPDIAAQLKNLQDYLSPRESLSECFLYWSLHRPDATRQGSDGGKGHSGLCNAPAGFFHPQQWAVEPVSFIAEH